jgi:SDR family mycofactocin-dependent oxidoreductase
VAGRVEARRRFEGKTVLVSGAARGQGRSHAVRFAAEGADVVAFDICAQVESCPVPQAGPEDLAETVRLVEEQGRRIVAEQADVRDFAAVQAVVEKGISELGQIDLVASNAGIFGHIGPFWEIPEKSWQEVIGTNLIGAWNVVRAAVPAMIERGEGGSVVITASTAGLRGYPNIADYVASKHGLIGLMRVMSQELAEHGIRVNAVCPTNVGTELFVNDVIKGLFAPGTDPSELSDEEFARQCRPPHLLPIGWVGPEDVSAAVLWLASPESRYVTGICLPVDGGILEKIGGEVPESETA